MSPSHQRNHNIGKEKTTAELARELRELQDKLNVLTDELKRKDKDLELLKTESLASSDRKITEIIESIQDGFLTLDHDWNFTYVNRRAAGNIGFEPEDIVGYNIWEKFPELRGTPHEAAYRKAMELREIQRIEIFGVLTDRWYNITVYPSSEGISVYWQDITERKRIDERIAFQANLLANITDVVYSTDDQLRLTSWNSAAEKIYGWKKDEVLGKNVLEVTGSTFDLDMRERLTRELMERGVVTVEIEHTTRSGGHIVFESKTMLLRDTMGKTVGFIGVKRDITECKRAEVEQERLLAQLKEHSDELQRVNKELKFKHEELAVQAEEIEFANETLRAYNEELLSITDSLRETGIYLDSLINYANAPIIVWDSYFTITRFNHAFERLSGYMADEVIGSNLGILFPQDSSEESLKQIQKTLAGEQWESVEIPIRHKSGSIYIALWNSANIYNTDKKLLATIAQGQDITERKRFESELSESKSQAELYLDLMGHDISNMHQVAIGQLELAQDILKTTGKLEAADHEMIDTSLESLWRSARLIDNVRKLQKIKSDEIKTKPISLDEVLVSVVNQYDRSSPGKKIAIDIGKGMHVVRANELLRDVFTNLIGNAIKHSNGSKVDIQVRLEDVTDNNKKYYRVSIEDNGPGIPDDMKDKVFNRLQRGETKARGIGLGLYLVKSLVNSYRGKVWVENRVQGDYTKGSRFIVLLPAVWNYPRN
jgi:PAS domain S-box-containing protein